MFLKKKKFYTLSDIQKRIVYTNPRALSSSPNDSPTRPKNSLTISCALPLNFTDLYKMLRPPAPPPNTNSIAYSFNLGVGKNIVGPQKEVALQCSNMGLDQYPSPKLVLKNFTT